MAIAHRDGLRLHYTDDGAGTPLLLLNGLGASSGAWSPLQGIFAAEHRVIATDHRGSGGSDLGTGPLTVAGLADDAAAVLDAAEIGSAHVVGNSLGGMVAQELALRHPGRVRSLVLAATSPGLGALPCHPTLGWHLWRAGRGSGEVRRRHLDLAFHGPAGWVAAGLGPVDPDEIHLPAGEGARRQLVAALRWSALRRLRRISAPTLVVHGTHDRLVPALNARLAARLIPGARLHLLPGAGHFFISDAGEAAARLIGAFVAQIDFPPVAGAEIGSAGLAPATVPATAAAL